MVYTKTQASCLIQQVLMDEWGIDVDDVNPKDIRTLIKLLKNYLRTIR